MPLYFFAGILFFGECYAGKGAETAAVRLGIGRGWAGLNPTAPENGFQGCVTNFVFLEKNDFFLVRITI